jgi:2-oxo-4-hydroxy-4-carboxy-5-ureidoimidazoline decarboxylase
MAPISLDALNRIDRAEFVAVLGGVVEHAPWVAEAIARARPFADLAAVRDAIGAALGGADENRRLSVLQAHPDLAGKAARAGALTRDSQAEQASAGLDSLSEQEFAQFTRLNDAYRAKFAIPFIICARRHTKASILRQFEQRLRNDRATEVSAALAEVLRIVALRLDQRIAAPDRLNVHGRLSTHVLDTYHGRPAAGVPIELVELSETGANRVVESMVTNADGRTDRAIIQDRPVPIGEYELRFRLAEYFRKDGVRLADPPFIDVVPIRFAVAEPEGSYHVPLLASPWSYTTYRGS